MLNRCRQTCGSLLWIIAVAAPLALAVDTSWTAQAARAQSGEQYSMDGKNVPRSFYDANVLMSQGMAYLHANKNTEASQKLKQAIAIAPDFAEAHHNYGLALAKLGQIPAAEEQFRAAISLNPNLDGSWLSLGGLYQSTGQVADAIETYKQFVARFPASKDTPKVASLIQGLGNVLAARRAVPQVKLPPQVGDDYLVDVTRDGLSRWPTTKMPLKVYIADGTGVLGYSSAYYKILKASFNDWSTASKGLVSFQFVDDPKNADIECSWLSDSKQLDNSAESGETRLMSNRSGILRGTIKLLTMPILPGQKVTDNSIRMICLHEIGHVLGLTGHTTNPDDTMFYSSTITARWTSPTKRDANTIIRLYTPLQKTAQQD